MYFCCMPFLYCCNYGYSYDCNRTPLRYLEKILRITSSVKRYPEVSPMERQGRSQTKIVFFGLLFNGRMVCSKKKYFNRRSTEQCYIYMFFASILREGLWLVLVKDITALESRGHSVRATVFLRKPIDWKSSTIASDQDEICVVFVCKEDLALLKQYSWQPAKFSFSLNGWNTRIHPSLSQLLKVLVNS